MLDPLSAAASVWPADAVLTRWRRGYRLQAGTGLPNAAQFRLPPASLIYFESPTPRYAKLWPIGGAKRLDANREEVQ